MRRTAGMAKEIWATITVVLMNELKAGLYVSLLCAWVYIGEEGKEMRAPVEEQTYTIPTRKTQTPLRISAYSGMPRDGWMEAMYRE
jgi:carbonic anhydrase